MLSTLVASLVLAPGLAQDAVLQVPFAYSQDDLGNQEAAMTYFETRYYNNENRWSLGSKDLADALAMARFAFQEQSLALGAAQVLYLYAWFTRTGEIMRENIVLSAQLFEVSINYAGCSRDLPTEYWLQLGCDIRFGQPAILYAWLQETEPSGSTLTSIYLERATQLLEYLKTVPRFADAGKNWTSPWDMNFNQLRYPDIPAKPIWNASKVPLAVFLEEHYGTFRSELEGIINAVDVEDGYEAIRRADVSVESLSTPGGWDAIRIVRYGNWNDAFCSFAPKTCALLKTRKELVNCPYVNTNYYKLFPGAHLKPHFGNAPRLTAHLAVIAPEPLRSGISVGPAQSLWIEGKSMVIDDTYPHSVSHWGQHPRYVLATWFCHPCDENHDSGQVCAESL